ncbi:hypothetical protein DL93DRAFT_2070925 [Clavulina sp. PMI_390]|nr:hypothetical protein DL93DRAFT_2070925 [Clavulina sp. PMI_390]
MSSQPAGGTDPATSAPATGPGSATRQATLDVEEALPTDKLSATGDIHEILRALRKKLVSLPLIFQFTPAL